MEPARMFRGGELPRLLLLAAILAAGWPLACSYLGRPRDPDEPRPIPAAEIPPMPPADEAVELAGVLDRTRLTIRDLPGYALLLQRARTTPSPELAAVARRDLPFDELTRDPPRYRGLPVHIEGTALQILTIDDIDPDLSPNRRLYEAWIQPLDGPRYPFVALFETPPEGLPGGRDLGERVAFDGYFFKLLAYDAADRPRFAPMLVGKIGWRPSGDAGRGGLPGPLGLSWWQWALLGLMTLTALRLILTLTRPRTPAWRPSTRLSPRDAIAPEDLDAWVRGEPERPEEDEDEDSFDRPSRLDPTSRPPN